MKMHPARLPLLLVMLALASSTASAEEPASPFTKESLPPAWTIEREVVVPAYQLGEFTQALGAPIVDLRNQYISVNGFPAQVNVILCEDEAGAEKVVKRLRGMRGKAFFARRGKRVYEVGGNNALLAARVQTALGLPAGKAKATYDVSFRAGLVSSCDYTTWNRVFNLFLMRQRRPDDESIQKQIRELTKSWTFGDTLTLRRSTPPTFEATWTFEPKPVETVEDGAVVHYTFEDPPKFLGIPYVEVRGTVEVAARFDALPDPLAAAGTEATSLWPAPPESVKALAAGEPTPRRRVLRLLAWLQAQIPYGGQVGSRDPVAEVLARGHGRCWDKSDVFVSLCRGHGIPARQVAGWLPHIRSGHIWTEVCLGEEGWIPVDATTPWLGVSTDYVPLFLTEDGEMRFAYLAWPEVKPR